MWLWENQRRKQVQSPQAGVFRDFKNEYGEISEIKQKSDHRQPFVHGINLDFIWVVKSKHWKVFCGVFICRDISM